MGIYSDVNIMSGIAGKEAKSVEDISKAMVGGDLTLGQMITQQIQLQMATAKLDITKGSVKVLTGQVSKVGGDLKNIG